MAIESLPELMEVTAGELYAVYLAIAQADHRWRIEALYGRAPRPAGHNVFRPLPRADFVERLMLARRIAGGEAILRGRLARQAAAYQVDVAAVIAPLRAAA